MVAPSQILSDCMYMWERTVMGISVHTAETEMATTPYYLDSTMYKDPAHAPARTASTSRIYVHTAILFSVRGRETRVPRVERDAQQSTDNTCRAATLMATLINPGLKPTSTCRMRATC